MFNQSAQGRQRWLDNKQESVPLKPGWDNTGFDINQLVKGDHEIRRRFYVTLFHEPTLVMNQLVMELQTSKMM